MAIAKIPKLLAVAPEDVKPGKPAVLIYGPPGVRKTWVSIDFPSVYFIDTEGGADLPEYRKKLREAGGAYLGKKEGSQDFETVIGQVQALATQQHRYRTVVVDSISKLWNIALNEEQERLGEIKSEWGAYKKAPTRQFMSLIKWLGKLDMNVILIAQQKDLYGLNEKKQREQIGYTYDAQDKLEHELHLSLRIARLGERCYAYIGKSRLGGFKTGDNFEWSYDEFAERYGQSVMEEDSTPLVLASEDQLEELQRLTSIVRVPEDWETKVFKKANVDTWADMNADDVDKCLALLRNRLTPVGADA